MGTVPNLEFQESVFVCLTNILITNCITGTVQQVILITEDNNFFFL